MMTMISRAFLKFTSVIFAFFGDLNMQRKKIVDRSDGTRIVCYIFVYVFFQSKVLFHL